MQQSCPNFIGRVAPSQHPLPPLQTALSTAIAAAQFAFIPLLLFGDAIFRMLGMASAPAWYAYLRDNKMIAIGLYFLLNVASSRLSSTGAFEVYLREPGAGESEDGLPAGWSLLHSAINSEGRMPAPAAIVRALQQRGACLVDPEVPVL